MIRLPSCRFSMGSAAGRSDEAPVHCVELSGFCLARHAVTNREYGLFLADARRPPPASWEEPQFSHPDQPVVAVSWHEAEAYCRWLRDCLGRPFRLPTEAEREFACRGGSEADYPWGQVPERELGTYGSRWGLGPEPVGGPPNGLGFCNMADNVHEWCSDWYDPDYYRHSPVRDPGGPEYGVRRASRGGSWRHQIKVTRSAARSSLPPGYRYMDYGFRVACTD